MSMSAVENALFLRALRRQPVDRTPVWIMRQAGRYLPEYRAVRAKAGDFLSLCKNPDLACEVTLQPLRRFSLDAAIIFSDILTIPDAMGLGLYFTQGEGPQFQRPLTDPQKIAQLPETGVIDSLQYVMETVRCVRRAMPADLPLIGFSGSPWTLACYMVEGHGSRDFKAMFKLRYTDPASTHLLLQKLTDTIIEYLSEQVKAGVNALMIFDTWGGLLSTPDYSLFSLQYMTQCVKTLKQRFPHIPLILFTKGCGLWLEAMADSGCDALGLDWTIGLDNARLRVGSQVALQGNLHPAVLCSTPEVIRREVQNILDAFGDEPGHVFNLGHGITPDVPPEHVQVLIEAVEQHSRKLRSLRA